MRQTKVCSKAFPSGQFVIQNVDQGFLALEKQYDLLYSVRYRTSTDIQLYRIFSATKEGESFDPQHCFRIFVPWNKGVGDRLQKSAFLKSTSEYLGQISQVVKTIGQFIVAVMKQQAFVVSFNDLLTFDAELSGYEKLIPSVTWEDCLDQEKGSTASVDIRRIGGADSFGNPIAFAQKSKQGGVIIKEASQDGRSNQHHPAHVSPNQFWQTNQPKWRNQPGCTSEGQTASVDSLSQTNQAVQASQVPGSEGDRQDGRDGAVVILKAAASFNQTKNLTPEQRQQIVFECVEQKISPTVLARKWKCNADTIRTWVRKAGFKLPAQYKQYNSPIQRVGRSTTSSGFPAMGVLDIAQMGKSGSISNPIAFVTTTMAGRVQMEEGAQDGQSIQHQQANFGERNQLHQTDQPKSASNN